MAGAMHPSGYPAGREPENRERERADRVRILLVDDQPIVRFGLRALLASRPRYDVIGEVSTVAEAVAVAQQQEPDLIVTELRLPDGSGVEICQQVHSRGLGTRVVVLTSVGDESLIVAAIRAGAAGYVLKQSGVDQVIQAIETVASGGSLLDPVVTRAVLTWLRHGSSGSDADALATLTLQERKILPLLVEGRTNREIGAALCLSEYTVKTHVSNILQKLHLARRSEVATYLARHGASAASLAAEHPPPTKGRPERSCATRP